MKIFLNISALSLLLLFCLAGCDKNEINYGDFDKLTSDQALLKINNVSYYSDNRATYFKINNKRVSGLLTARSPFPGGGYNTGGASSPDFLTIPSGNVKLEIALPYKIDTGLDSLILYSTNLQITGGKNYVVHITDTAATTKNVLTEERFARADTATSRYRFINLMPNVPAVDLYYGSSATVHTADTLIAGNVSYLSTTNEIVLKSGQSKTWKIRPAGAALTTPTILASYTSASTFTSERVYTIFASGYNGTTIAPRRPYVSFFLVR